MQKKTMINLEVAEQQVRIVHGAYDGSSLYINNALVVENSVWKEVLSGKDFVGKKLMKMALGKGPLVALPRRYFIVKYFSFPSGSPDELKKMTLLQLLNQLPYKQEEFRWEWSVLEILPTGLTRVVAVVLTNEVWERFERFLMLRKVRPSGITMSSVGLLGWHELHEKSQGSHEQQGYMVVAIDKDATEVCCCAVGKIFFSRWINLGKNSFHDQKLVSWIAEVILSLATYRKEQLGPSMQETKVVFLDDFPSALKEKLEKELGLPVTVVDPYDNIQLKFADGLLKENREASLAVGIGLLAVDANQLVRFASASPARIPDSKLWVKRVGMVILLLAFYASFLALGSTKLIQQSKELASIHQELASIKPQVESAQKRMKFFESLANQWSLRLPVLDLIEQLHVILPNDIILTQIGVSASGEVNLQGIANSGSSVNRFQNELVASSLLRGVKLSHATKRMNANGKEMTDFSIVAEIIRSAKEGSK